MASHRILWLTGSQASTASYLAGYEVVTIENDLDMLYLLARDSDFDLILGDVQMPDILTRLRDFYPNIPVLILARQMDCEAGFQAGRLGAAGYLSASVDANTLLARVEEAIRQGAGMPPNQTMNGGHTERRSLPAKEGQRFLSVRELTIDRYRNIALFRRQPLDLTPREFEILACLVENKGRVMLFEELVFMLEGDYVEHEVARRFLTGHITNLRKKLKQAGGEQYILNSWARGYMIESDVEAMLRLSEARQRLVMEQMPGVVWCTDADLRLTWVSGAEYLAYAKMPPETPAGISLYDLLRNEGPESPTLQAHLRALKGEAVSYERRRMDQYYQAHVEPLKDADGTIIGTISLALNVTERKLAEERYRIISSMMSDYVYAARLLPGDEYNTEVEWVAGALTKITGFTEEEVKSGMRWDELVHPEDWHIVEARRKALLNGERVTCEFRMTGKHGRTYWLRTYTCPLWDDREGRVVAIFSAVQDITARREAEEALKRSEERYRTVSQVMSDYVYCFRIESEGKTQLEWMTGAYERITGYTIEEAMSGIGWTKIIHPDDAPLLRQRIQRLLAGQKDTSEWRIITKQGDIRWLRMYGQPIVEDGCLVRVYAAAQDITEQREAQEALREAEAYLRTVLTNLPVILWALDKQGVFTLVEGKGLEKVGLQPEQVVGKSVYDIYRYRPEILEGVKRAFQGKAVATLVEIRGVQFEARYTPICDEAGEVSGIIGVSIDLSWRAQTPPDFNDSLLGGHYLSAL